MIGLIRRTSSHPKCEHERILDAVAAGGLQQKWRGHTRSGGGLQRRGAYRRFRIGFVKEVEKLRVVHLRFSVRSEALVQRVVPFRERRRHWQRGWTQVPVEDVQPGVLLAPRVTSKLPALARFIVLNLETHGHVLRQAQCLRRGALAAERPDDRSTEVPRPFGSAALCAVARLREAKQSGSPDHAATRAVHGLVRGEFEQAVKPSPA
mmetsp:Transcript_45791/g.115415  ORF Transcript_45791/g.115415 Transcript_45791/m.115415 type:complete len:207 (-) Transcript_45791:13-633(-)